MRCERQLIVANDTCCAAENTFCRSSAQRSYQRRQQRAAQRTPPQRSVCVNGIYQCTGGLDKFMVVTHWTLNTVRVRGGGKSSDSTDPIFTPGCRPSVRRDVRLATLAFPVCTLIGPWRRTRPSWEDASSARGLTPMHACVPVSGENDQHTSICRAASQKCHAVLEH